MSANYLAPLGLTVLLWSLSNSPAQVMRLHPARGRVKLEGTSNLDDWQAESRSVRGFLEVGGGFPLVRGQKVDAGKVPIKAEATIEVASLKSIEKDGKPFSNKMDEIMHEKLRARENPAIVLRLRELRLSSPPSTTDNAYEFTSAGELVVGGVTNSVSLPLSVVPMPNRRIRIWGSTSLKMSDFRIDPPVLKIALGLIRTGDRVSLSFDCVWVREESDHSTN